MIDFLKIVILSLLSVFLGHQIFNYVKSKYIDSNATLDMLRESKKMYEDVASALNSSSSKINHPNKKGNNVSIHEEENEIKVIPNRIELVGQSNTTSLDMLVNENAEINSESSGSINELDMQSELTNYMNSLSK